MSASGPTEPTTEEVAGHAHETAHEADDDQSVHTGVSNDHTHDDEVEMVDEDDGDAGDAQESKELLHLTPDGWRRMYQTASTRETVAVRGASA